MKRIILILSVAIALFASSCKQKTAESLAPVVVEGQQIEVQKMITARVFIKPGREADFAEAAKWIIENTLKEEGCLQYTLYQDPYDGTNFFFFERYKSQAAVDAHFAASYFTEFGTKIADMTTKDAEIIIWDISENK